MPYRAPINPMVNISDLKRLPLPTQDLKPEQLKAVDDLLRKMSTATPVSSLEVLGRSFQAGNEYVLGFSEQVVPSVVGTVAGTVRVVTDITVATLQEGWRVAKEFPDIDLTFRRWASAYEEIISDPILSDLPAFYANYASKTWESYLAMSPRERGRLHADLATSALAFVFDPAVVNASGPAASVWNIASTRRYMTEVRDIYARTLTKAGHLSGDVSTMLFKYRAVPELGIPLYDTERFQKIITGLTRFDNSVTVSRPQLEATFGHQFSALHPQAVGNFVLQADDALITLQSGKAIDVFAFVPNAHVKDTLQNGLMSPNFLNNALEPMGDYWRLGKGRYVSLDPKTSYLEIVSRGGNPDQYTMLHSTFMPTKGLQGNFEILPSARNTSGGGNLVVRPDDPYPFGPVQEFPLTAPAPKAPPAPKPSEPK